MKNLGEYLKALREAKGLTLREVEKLADISNAYLSQIESNKIKKPSPTILHKLSLVYGITYDALMDKAGYPSGLSATTSLNTTHTFQRFGEISKDEEIELLEYLKFMRSRKK